MFTNFYIFKRLISNDISQFEVCHKFMKFVTATFIKKDDLYNVVAMLHLTMYEEV